MKCHVASSFFFRNQTPTALEEQSVEEAQGGSKEL